MNGGEAEPGIGGNDQPPDQEARQPAVEGEWLVIQDEVNWARGADGPWHRVSGFPEAPGSANTLCGLVLTDPRNTSPDPPLDSTERCHDCMIEGEAQPANH